MYISNSSGELASKGGSKCKRIMFDFFHKQDPKTDKETLPEETMAKKLKQVRINLLSLLFTFGTEVIEI